MKNRRAKGSTFEDIACAFLEKKGYQIIGRNVILLRRELDIVALDGETVVFVEVKGRHSLQYGSPAEAVDEKKRAGIARAAAAYLEQANLWDRPTRFDVVTIIADDDQGGIRIDHIMDAFRT